MDHREKRDTKYLARAENFIISTCFIFAALNNWIFLFFEKFKIFDYPASFLTATFSLKRADSIFWLVLFLEFLAIGFAFFIVRHKHPEVAVYRYLRDEIDMQN